MNSYQMVLHRPVETAPFFRAVRQVRIVVRQDCFRVADNPEINDMKGAFPDTYLVVAA
jgi:hypothetical protein